MRLGPKLALPAQKPVRYVAVLAGLTALYVVFGKLGLTLALEHPSATPVWPPTGIALAALLLLGFRVWPAVFAGAFIVNLGVTGLSLTTLGIGVGNTLEALAGAYLVNRYANGVQAFERAPSVFRFFLVGPLSSTAISATVGASSLELGGFAELVPFGRVWLTWWLGDMVGAVLIAPLIILWSRPPRRQLPPGRSLELIAVLISTVAIAWVSFSGEIFRGSGPLAFLCLPPLVWAAFRFRPREAVAAALLLALITTWETLEQTGPFAVASFREPLLLLQVFLVVGAVLTLVLAAMVNEREIIRQELEKHLARSTEDLAQALDELQEIQKALLRREKLAFLGQLASGVSHELRNPLGVMSNAVYYLGQVIRDPPEKVREYLDILRTQITLSETIVSNLLDLARIRAPEKSPVLIPELIEGQVRRLGGTQRATIAVEFPPDLPPVLADEVQVGQIVFNVLTNAVQAMGEAGGMLTVRARSTPDSTVRVDFADTGPGIPAHEIEQVFEPLFTTRARGIGLGLTVSRQMARANGGDLIVVSRPGQGATFTLILPAAGPEDRAA